MYAFQSISVSARVRVRSSPYRMSATGTNRELVGPTQPPCRAVWPHHTLTHSLTHALARSLAEHAHAQKSHRVGHHSQQCVKHVR
jgi:hypothetical protein